MTILDLCQNYVQLRRSGRRHIGPCPSCGGSSTSDKFVVYPDKDNCHCFACGLNGDAVKILRELEGLGCPDAHERLGLSCTSTTCPVLDKCRLGNKSGSVPRPVQSLKVKEKSSIADWQPSSADTPADIWQHKAAAMVASAHQCLLDTPAELDYLARRGLPLEAVQKYRLGFVAQDFWRSRESWGLPTELKNGKPKKLWIPSGILIPLFAGKSIQRIRIRRPQGEPRYYWLSGSGNDTFLLGAEKKAFVVVESDLDGLMIHHAAGDLVGVASMGNTSSKPKVGAADLLKQAKHISLAFDLDNNLAGGKAARWWQENYPQSSRWPVPQGKDPGEAYHAGVDIRAWVRLGLPPAFRLQAPLKPVFQLQPEPQEQPKYSKGRSKSGRPYIIATDKETYFKMLASVEDAAVFSPREIGFLQGMDKQSAELHLITKQVFPGCWIESIQEVNYG